MSTLRPGPMTVATMVSVAALAACDSISASPEAYPEHTTPCSAEAFDGGPATMGELLPDQEHGPYAVANAAGKLSVRHVTIMNGLIGVEGTREPGPRSVHTFTMYGTTLTLTQQCVKPSTNFEWLPRQGALNSLTRYYAYDPADIPGLQANLVAD